MPNEFQKKSSKGQETIVETIKLRLILSIFSSVTKVNKSYILELFLRTGLLFIKAIDKAFISHLENAIREESPISTSLDIMFLLISSILPS